MRRRQWGQTSTEYVVVIGALISGLLVVEATECPGYDNCVGMLLSKVQNRYKGYAAGITGVHNYGNVKAVNYAADDVATDDSSDDTASGGGDLLPPEGISSSQVITSEDGSVTYGTLEGTNVVDDDGNVVGTYDGSTFTPSDGGVPVPAGNSMLITDSDGTPVEPTVLVDCATNKPEQFVYKSEVTGELHEANALEVITQNPGQCGPFPSVEVESQDGSVDEGGRVYDGMYYDINTAVPLGEVIYVNTTTCAHLKEGGEETDAYTTCESTGEGLRTLGPTCAVLPVSWDAMTVDSEGNEIEPVQNYLEFEDSGNAIGYVTTSSGCPATLGKNIVGP
tara:strand:+ start:604 stop:1611 length:1008 start_codon:yes stop_codon:yes gene_type:complete